MFLSCLSSRVARLFMLGLILLAGGCAQEISPPACTVTGKLMINGRPAVGACIRFHTTENVEALELPEATRCEEDGTFSLGLRKPGEYLITFFWPIITIEEGEEIEGPDRLRMNYKDPRHSKQKVTVKEGVNQLDPIKIQASLASS